MSIFCLEHAIYARLMLDGNLIGEYQLGKYNRDKDDIKAREEHLASWLLKMGF